ncbi:MAG: NAD(P)-binding domain-containing protein [Actinomycetota bacterium]
MSRVGLIGLGVMGMPIARNLMERGFEVAGYRKHHSTTRFPASPPSTQENAHDVVAGHLPAR